MSFLVFWPNLAKNMLVKGMHFLEHIHLMKKKPERQEKLEASMEHYEAAAVYFKTHKKVIGNVMIITFAQRFALFFVTWFVYKAFGLSGTSIYDVVMLQAVVSVSVDMLPLPGGMGISENLFLIIFKGVFAGSLLLPGMVLSRGIAYYVQLLFSAVMTSVAHFRIGYSQTE